MNGRLSRCWRLCGLGIQSRRLRNMSETALMKRCRRRSVGGRARARPPVRDISYQKRANNYLRGACPRALYVLLSACQRRGRRFVAENRALRIPIRSDPTVWPTCCRLHGSQLSLSINSIGRTGHEAFHARSTGSRFVTRSASMQSISRM